MTRSNLLSLTLAGAIVFSCCLGGCSVDSKAEGQASRTHKARKVKVKEGDYAVYVGEVQKIICRQWRRRHPNDSKGSATNSGAVSLAIDKKGHVSAVQILKSSGSPQFDQDMKDAWENIELPPPPPGGPEQLSLQFTFAERIFDDPLLERDIDLSKSLASLDEEIKENPQRIDLYWQRGNLFLLNSDSRAIGDLSKVVSARTYGGEAYLARARAFEDAGQWQKCLNDCLTALALNPDSVETRILLADSYQKMHNFERALTTINEAINLAPDTADAYASRAYLALCRGDYQATIADCRKAIELDPRCASAWAYSGDAESELNNYSQALKDYSKAVDNDPDEPSLLLRRAELFNDMGQFSKAVVDATEAIKLDPDNGEAYFCRAFANKELGFSAQSKSDHSKAMRLGFKG